MNRQQPLVIETMCALLLPLGAALLLGSGALLKIFYGGSLWWLIVPALVGSLYIWWRRRWERRYAGVLAMLGVEIAGDEPEIWPGLKRERFDPARETHVLQHPSGDLKRET